MLYSSLAPATAVVVALTAGAALASPFSRPPPLSLSKRASVCNGDASLCSRLYSNVTFIGSHDSYAISDNSIAANQVQSISAQLNDGVRMLQSQAHSGGNSTSGIELCHTSCNLFDGGSLENWLSQIKSWSDANPNEVVTLLIVNSDGLPATTFAKAYEASGIAGKSYQAANSGAGIARTSWPTLGALIDAGTPIVSFLASGADTSSVPYLLDEFSNMWENAYDQVNVPPFNCSVDRIGQGKSASELMYIANHFKDLSLGGSIVIPDKANLETTNSEASILTDAQNCASLPQSGARNPNFILLDFENTPAQQPFQAAAKLNGVTYHAPTTSSSSAGTGTSQKGTTSSGSSSGAVGLSATAPAARTAAGLLLAAVLAGALL